MYTLIYNPDTGKLNGINNDGVFIPIDRNNGDFIEFIKWNLAQPVPFDLNKTIPIEPPTISELKKLNAAGLAKAIPNWATWTQAQADAWYQTNVRDPFTAATTLAAMKLVIGTMINVLWAVIQMILALRDENWPDLPDRITIK